MMESDIAYVLWLARARFLGVGRMRYAVLLGTGFLALLFAGVASASALPEGGATVDEVAAVLRSMKLNAEIGTDASGDPKIRSNTDDVEFYVYFYSCKNGRCAAIQFSEGFDLDQGISCEQLDRWNRQWRYGRAFRDEENDPYVQMDVDLQYGSTTESIKNNLEVWLTVLNEFTRHISSASKSEVTT